MNEQERLEQTSSMGAIAAPVRRSPLLTCLARFARWCCKAAWRILQFLLIAWATLAIYYSNLPSRPARLALALALAAFSVWSLWVTRPTRMRWPFAGAFAGASALRSPFPQTDERQQDEL